MASTQNMDPSTNTNAQKEADSKNEYPKDNHSVTKRLQNDLKTLLFAAAPGISAFPINDNLFKWRATVVGGASTVYDGLEYKLIIDFPSGYPYSAPSVKFESACYHPNVDKFGNICLDILKEKWTASYDARTILLSIQSLLAEPNNDSPLNSHAAELWDDKMAYKKYLLDHYEKNVKSASASKS